jgi:putative membrane fusion protein
MIYETTDSISFKGIHVRNERLVRYSGVDVVSYIHPDASLLRRNEAVAKSYNSVEDVLLQQRIDRIGERINLLEDAEVLVNTDISQLESYVNQIQKHHRDILEQINVGNFNMVRRHKDEYIRLQSRMRIIRGDSYDYREYINMLGNERASLRSRMSADARDVRIEESGYFVSITDGYESILNFDRIGTLDRNDIEAIIREPERSVSSDIIGKMVDGYKWRFVGVLDTNKTRSFLYEGAEIRFRTGGSMNIVSATVIGVNRLDDGTSIITFECDTFTPEFASRRVSQFHIILEEHSGIRIPSTAISFNDAGERGVYVRDGATLIFRRFNQIKIERDFFIVEDTTEKAGYVSRYDNVVIRGRDLYEGKIVR